MTFSDPFDYTGLVLNVLTRTSDRPNRFRRCRESIKAQKWGGRIRHVVSVDRPCTYVEADAVVPSTGRMAPEVPAVHAKHRDAPYNLYVNDLLSAVTDGWILVLDDDDELLVPDALAKLEPYMDDFNNMIIFKFSMGDGVGKRQFVMPKAHGKALVANDVPCSCYIYHSKHRESGMWHGKYSGDYFAASNLAEKLNIVWVDEVLAGTQVGPSEGSIESMPYSKWKARKITQNKEEPFVSIIIPVLNQVELTKAVLENIGKTVTMPYEVIIIDNGSTDETPAFLEHEHLKHVRNKRNMGMSVAWNHGGRKAKGTHMCFLNNDLVLADGWLEKLLEHDEHAICPSYEQGPDLRTDFEKRNTALAKKTLQVNEADIPGLHPKGFAGFIFMISREVWDRVGRFDEDLLYWYGDTDYYWRMKAMGYRPVMSRNVLIHHWKNRTCDTLEDFIPQRERDRQVFLGRWPDGLQS
ncbi:glycosyltransferase [Candidatus Pacearchaeota archaeon]|nr:glycosyltransferase [Candidatus Pacearchaeota archaeon]